MTYDEACERAATGQGLDPVTAILRENGFAPEVWQTGGFCMVVAVPNADRTEVVWITSGEEWHGRKSEYLVATYDMDDENADGTPLCEVTDGASLEHLPTIVAALFAI